MDKNAKALFEKIADLEQAAKRGLQINEELLQPFAEGQVISVDYCNATLKSCALFRKWFSEYVGS